MKFDEIIGNEDVKLQLNMASQSAIVRNTSIPHTIFTGSPGCGKTSMSKALAEKVGADFFSVPAESMKSTKDILGLFEQFNLDGYDRDGNITGTVRPDIIFFDEIHNMPLKGQEVMGIAMEEWYIPTRNNYTGIVSDIWLPRFTIIGATTLLGKLSKPFRDRFKLTFYFETYSDDELVLIIKKHAEFKSIGIDDDAARNIASRSRGTPRVAISFLDRVRDAAVVTHIEQINSDLSEAVFRIMGIDKNGLTKNDIKILKTLYEYGAPVGVDTLSILLNEQVTSVENSIEPFLIQKGLMARTGKGRAITQKGLEYMNDMGYTQKKGRRF